MNHVLWTKSTHLSTTITVLVHFHILSYAPPSSSGVPLIFKLPLLFVLPVARSFISRCSRENICQRSSSWQKEINRSKADLSSGWMFSCPRVVIIKGFFVLLFLVQSDKKKGKKKETGKRGGKANVSVSHCALF